MVSLTEILFVSPPLLNVQLASATIVKLVDIDEVDYTLSGIDITHLILQVFYPTPT
jgi:hypothetical protein